jgi:methylenetetrahydrofolate--tRNA-(uracil-5-)-methyltransferase
MNLVGFQTRLKYGAQQEILRTLPGLAKAEFLRLGSIHRNTYVCTPRVLDAGLRVRTAPWVQLAGQIVGCEGYTESSAMGLWAALTLLGDRAHRPLPPPPRTTMLGALLDYLQSADPKRFAPMNVNFGLLPAEWERPRGTDRKQFRIEQGRRCVSALQAWAVEHGVAAPRSLPGGEAARRLAEPGGPLSAA